jgi:hypothetical protein
MGAPEFEIRISEAAKALVYEKCAQEGFARPALMIHRQGPTGDVTRTTSGQAAWAVERPHPWRARIGEFETIEDTSEDIHIVSGLRIWLALIPRPGEAGVEITAREGELHVEAIA